MRLTCISNGRIRIYKPALWGLKMSSQTPPESQFASRPHKCLKWAPRTFLRAILPGGSRNAQNEPPEASWEPVFQEATEMLKMNHKTPPESHFASQPQKCSKRAPRGLLSAILAAGARNAENEAPEASWEPFGQQTPEMLKMRLQRLLKQWLSGTI